MSAIGLIKILALLYGREPAMVAACTAGLVLRSSGTRINIAVIVLCGISLGCRQQTNDELGLRVIADIARSTAFCLMAFRIE